jgi:hypothetical protein
VIHTVIKELTTGLNYTFDHLPSSNMLLNTHYELEIFQQMYRKAAKAMETKDGFVADCYFNYVDIGVYNLSRDWVRPNWINVVREPISRYVSHFYYMARDWRMQNKILAPDDAKVKIIVWSEAGFGAKWGLERSGDWSEAGFGAKRGLEQSGVWSEAGFGAKWGLERSGVWSEAGFGVKRGWSEAGPGLVAKWDQRFRVMRSGVGSEAGFRVQAGFHSDNKQGLEGSGVGIQTGFRAMWGSERREAGFRAKRGSRRSGSVKQSGIWSEVGFRAKRGYGRIGVPGEV